MTTQSLEERLTEAVRQNDELRKAAEEYRAQLRIAEKGREHALQTARLANEEVQHFIYAMGHDLRAALRNVVTHSQLLQRQQAQNPETKDFVKVILEGASEMNGFIEDVLAFSRAGAASTRTHIDLGVIVKLQLMNLDKEIKESGAVISFENLPEAEVNESDLGKVFFQLFRNAMRYRNAEPPRIEVTSEEKSDAFLISVRDNGVGIRPDYHKQVFAPFKRLHGKEVPGRGLGLAMARKIIRAHGGEIWVESDGQHGSVFRFTLPYQP